MFECLKFRTMIPNAEQVLREVLENNPNLKAEWAENHKLKRDPRVTWIGRFLRKTSLDELPQLWNILRGEMSLVGPRPVTLGELAKYGRYAVHYQSVRPGLTGMWQVSGRSETGYQRRVAFDVCYVRHRNVVFDISILLRTVLVVLRGGLLFSNHDQHIRGGFEVGDQGFDLGGADGDDGVGDGQVVPIGARAFGGEA